MSPEELAQVGREGRAAWQGSQRKESPPTPGPTPPTPRPRRRSFRIHVDEPQKHHLEGKKPDVYTPHPEDTNLERQSWSHRAGVMEGLGEMAEGCSVLEGVVKMF